LHKNKWTDLVKDKPKVDRPDSAQRADKLRK
jgi:hypothetical protein